MNMEYKAHELQDSVPPQLDANHMDIKTALESLEPSDRAIKWSTFKESYDYIEAALARNVTKTKILAMLELKGLKLSVNTFNKMLDAERERRQPPEKSGEKPDDTSMNATDKGSQEVRHD
jgi:hypothetical protein